MTGIIIIVAIALAVMAIGIALHWLQTKGARARPDSHERKPQQPGAVGRVGKTRGP
jgi:flagellar basal body-associated protein FliL